MLFFDRTRSIGSRCSYYGCEAFGFDVGSMGIFFKCLILESDVGCSLTTSISCCVVGVVDVILSTRSYSRDSGISALKNRGSFG
jgi:hypothetical protein